MARYHTEDVSAALAAADNWKRKCLLDDGSVLSPNRIWTTELLSELWTHFIDSPDEGDRSFLEKLKDQLAPASPRTRQLAAEMLWVLMLIVSKSNTGAATKRQLVRTVWGWSGEELRDTEEMLGAPLENGIANTGTAYNTRRWREMAFVIRLATALKEMTADARARLLNEPWEFGEWVDQLTPDERPQFRHVVKYLLFPDQYERICTGHHKKEILAAFKGERMAELRKEGLTAIDKKLYELRQQLTKEHGTEDLDFYRAPLNSKWRDEDTEGPDDETSIRYWKVAPGSNAQYWNQCKNGGYIAMGWEEPGSAAGLTREQYMQQQEAFRKEHPEYEMDRSAQAWKFAQIAEGDRIVANRGTTEVLGIGTVTGPYFHKSETYGHRLPVRWDVLSPVSVDEPGWRRTLIEISEKKFRQIEAKAGGKTQPEIPAKPDGPKAKVGGGESEEPYEIENALADLFLPMDQLETILETLRAKKNVILQGPPGVGKSFFASRLAFALMKSASPKRMRTVQFHPSYSYEDFVQGFRPGLSGFELRDGTFVSFCHQALADADNKYVFIIDEINRANLSKVLGELMVLIEHDKREEKWALPLAYSPRDAAPFYVPPNVYLIGMMNTADRSLAVVDYALRRRFAFFDIEPAIESDAFKEHLLSRGVGDVVAARVIRRISDLNKRIASDTTNLGRGFRIGHSYFCGGPLGTVSPEIWYARIVRTELEPLVREYWYDDPAEAESLTKGLLAPD